MKFISLLLLLVSIVESRELKAKASKVGKSKGSKVGGDGDNGDSVCPARKSQDSVPNASYPSGKRQRKLGKAFELDIIDQVTYTTTFDDKSEADSFLHEGGWHSVGVGYVSDHLRFDGSDLESSFEANVVCASKCEAVNCDYFVVHSSFSAKRSPSYLCIFLKKDAFTAKTENFYPAFIPATLTVSTESIILRKSANVTIPVFKDTVACNTPLEGDLEAAIKCLFLADLNETELVACNKLLTDDFKQYILPAVQCGGTLVQECLACVTAAFSTGSCGTEICEEDNALNKITATPCGEDELEGTDGCICNACGNSCPKDCKAKIQTALLCNTGANLKEGATGIVGSCINANFPGGPQILVEDFSCAFVKD